MTDNEIIKGLECCGAESDCENCPYFKNKHHTCGKSFNTDVLDLINRQKAEIEALQMDKKQLESDIIIANNNYEHIKSIWENDYQKLSQVIAKWKDKYKRLVIQEDIKAKAVKEFVMRFEKKIRDVKFTLGQTWEIQSALKEVEKEMVGEG